VPVLSRGTWGVLAHVPRVLGLKPHAAYIQKSRFIRSRISSRSIIEAEWQSSPKDTAQNRRGLIRERNHIMGAPSFSPYLLSAVVAPDEVKYPAGLCTDGSELPPLFHRVFWLS
jgi:hypothetical protein